MSAVPSHPHRRRVEEMRRLGYAGNVIPRHRALLTAHGGARKVLPALFLALGTLAAWLWILFPWTTTAWFQILAFWQERIGLGESIGMAQYRFAGVYDFECPWVSFSAGLPDRNALMVGAVVTALVLVASFLVPKRLAPLIYALRVLAITQATAEIFFYYWPEAFPYDGPGYVHGMLLASLALLSIVPVMLAFLYYVFDFTFLRKAWLTVLVLAHLALFCPLQYLTHALVLHHGSLLMMPLMFLAFGLPLDVMIFIAFYGWGMSWKSELREAP
jgi:hypothetical protein